MPIGDPRLCAVQEGGEYYSSVDADLGGFLQVFVVSDTVVESAKRAASLGQSVVDLFANLVSRSLCQLSYNDFFYSCLMTRMFLHSVNTLNCKLLQKKKDHHRNAFAKSVYVNGRTSVFHP